MWLCVGTGISTRTKCACLHTNTATRSYSCCYWSIEHSVSWKDLLLWVWHLFEVFIVVQNPIYVCFSYSGVYFSSSFPIQYVSKFIACWIYFTLLLYKCWYFLFPSVIERFLSGIKMQEVFLSWLYLLKCVAISFFFQSNLYVIFAFVQICIIRSVRMWNNIPSRFPAFKSPVSSIFIYVLLFISQVFCIYTNGHRIVSSHIHLLSLRLIYPCHSIFKTYIVMLIIYGQGYTSHLI